MATSHAALQNHAAVYQPLEIYQESCLDLIVINVKEFQNGGIWIASDLFNLDVSLPFS